MEGPLIFLGVWLWAVGLVVYRLFTGPHPANWLGALAWPVVASARGYHDLWKLILGEAPPRPRRAR
ncbi:MAG: hypothetical protein JWP35_3510 [Caulobacter sp.]|nr:hypothetical protein [Caulobacter sp.]